MTNYSEKFISYTDVGQEITSVTAESGDTYTVNAHIKKYNTNTELFEYITPESIYAVVEKYENNTFTTLSNADVFESDTGIYKTIFAVPSEPGIYYLKTVVVKDGYTDLNRLKIRAKVDV